MMRCFELPRQSKVRTTCSSFIIVTYDADQDQLRQLNESFPLLDYSCKMWATQARVVQWSLDESELSLIDRFMETQRLATDASNFRLWVNFLISDADPQVVRQAEPLYYAVSRQVT